MILVIDGNNLAFVVNMSTRLSTKDDFPTQAIAGFFKSLTHYVTKFEPEKIFIAWDGGKSKRRMEILPVYKENRLKEKTPEQNLAFEEFKMQVPVIQKMASMLGCHHVMAPGVEGDDLVAMLVRAASNKGKEAVIVSNDGDFLQLVGPNVQWYGTTTRKAGRHITADNMEKIHGLKPEQYLEFKCIVGDTSDSIPGVKGVGEKTAKEILQRYGSLKAFRKAVDAGEIKKLPARWRHVCENRGVIETNRLMMDLKAPAADFPAVAIIPPTNDPKSLRAEFALYEIREIHLNFNSWLSQFNCLQVRREAA